MIPFAIILGYCAVAVLIAISSTRLDKIAWEYNYNFAEPPSFSFNFGVSLFWPLTIVIFIGHYVPKMKPLYDHVRAAKTRMAEEQREKFKLEKRKAMIREINADVDRFEDTRREDVLSGREIIDTSNSQDRKNCYVCNKAQSPYAKYEYGFSKPGELINTISGVPAHEDCLMGDLNLEGINNGSLDKQLSEGA